MGKPFKRVLIFFVLPLLLVAGGISTRAVAAGSNSSISDIILCGLWSRANFNLNLDCSNTSSGSSNKNTQPATATPQPAPVSPSPSSPAPPTTGTYAALGDSVAAGAGLLAGSAVSAQDTQCDRSSQAYPYLVAAARSLALVDAACSGATAGDLVTQQRISGTNPVAQLDTAFASGTPRLITITAGANDAHWQTFLRACYTINCATTAFTTAADAYLVALQIKLNYALSSIQSRSDGAPPQVLVTGYYNPVSNRCSSLTPQVTPSEITWLAGETNALNQTIQDTVRNFSFATFVPVNFAGHDVCSGNSWVQGLLDPAPFHPTARGQQAIADSVISALR